MSKVKIIDTGKCKLLAVMVPDDARKFYIYEADWLQEEHSLHWRMPDNTDGVLYFSDIQSEYKIVGLSTELTEEQWSELLHPFATERRFGGRVLYSSFTSMDTFETAIESGLSLLEANQCYSVNPYQNPDATKILGGSPSGSDYEVLDELRDQWQQAQEKTRTWLILKSK